MCGINNLDLCSKSKKAEIEKLLNMNLDELKNAVEEGEKKLQAAEEHFQAEVEKLQTQYESMQAELDSAKKSSGLGLLKSVLAKKKTGDAKDEL